jgi:serine/threonine-protein kinase CLA4
MNPGPAPRPPTDRPRLGASQSSISLSSSVSNLNLQSATNASTTSLVQRSKTETFPGADSIVKEGNAKVKEDVGLLGRLVWADRFLVLREHQLDFLKSQFNSKIASSISLRDITNVTRSEVYPYSFEITRIVSSGNSSSTTSPARDGPSKSTICKVDTENDVYAWIDAIYPRCPGMGGVSNPTNFTHRVHVGFDPVSGAFTGLPQEWERLLTASAITKEDYQKNPGAVVEVLTFFTENMKRADDPLAYPGMTSNPPIESHNRQMGYSSSGSSIAGPRPTPPAQRQNPYESIRADQYSSMGEKPSYSAVNEKPSYSMNEKSSYSVQSDREREQQVRQEEERRRRMDEEIRRKERREQERREQERREREELAAYNASLPKSRPPLAKQEIGGFSEPQEAATDPRYNPSRPAPSTPMSPRDRQQPTRSNLQAQRPAPSAPKTSGQPSYPSGTVSKPAVGVNGQRPPQSSSKYAANGSPTTRGPNGLPQQRVPGVQAPKPLNVQSKQPQDAKKAEPATRKEEGGRKEVRMSSMSEAEVMAKLREVVSKERPLDSYNKQKKIGQGASGSVYVARIRENPTSAMARKILRENGPKAQVAIKQMDLRSQPRKELIVNEIIVMKDSKHENIVNFLDAFLQEDQSELWVVMEFMEGGALTDVIDNNGAISEDQIATVCLEVCRLDFPIHR